MKEIGKIITYTGSFKKFYAVAAFFVIAIALLNQIAPLLTKQIVDLIVAKLQGKTVGITPLIVLLGLVFLSNIAITAFTAVSQYIGDLMAVKLNNYLSQKYYSHVLHLSVDYFDNELTGKIVNRLDRGIYNITNLIQQLANSFLPTIVSTIITLIIISVFSWELAVLLVLLFPVFIYITNRSSVAWRKIESEKNNVFDITSGRVFEAISSIRVIKSFIKETEEILFFKKSREKIYTLTKQQSKQWHIYDFYRGVSLNLIMFSVFAYIIYFTFKGKFTIGEMTLLLQLSNNARYPLFGMSYYISQIQQAQAGTKDFFDILETPVGINDRPNAVEIKNVEGNVVFNDVCFGYKQDSYVLKQISFKLLKGEKLAIVGESGEGKSTLANLLLRFYEPQKGTVTIDNIDILDIKQMSLRKNIGVVFQETYLFSGTVFDNIHYGNKDATSKQVLEAAKIANADSFISKLPKGYETEIGERGIRLSGGQKQRIAIARALLKDPPILIFDEATSSLDSKAEFEVQQGLNRLMHGRTTIIIAHRLSTVKSVDQIIVLQNGRIVEKGSPRQLEKKKGVYAELLSYQNLAAEEKLKAFNINV